MRTRFTTALLAVVGILTSASPSHAGGSTMHLAQASFAIERVEDAELRQILEANLNAYLNGANFPDAFNLGSVAGEWLATQGYVVPTNWYYSTHQAHSAWFLTHYADFVRTQREAGVLDDALLAHFMGTMAHIVGDWRFDRYMVTATTRECFEGLLPKWAQEWTDISLDWVLAPLRNDPASGIWSPTSAYVPFDVGHQWIPFVSEPSVLGNAYPGGLTIPYPLLEIGVEIGFQYTVAEPLLAPFAKDTFCVGPSEWATAVGGQDDGADAIAAAINATWDILERGGVPEYEEYCPEGWGNSVDFTVSDALGSALDRVEVTAWIGGPEEVTRIQLEGDRIAALLEYGDGTERLAVLDGDVNDDWELRLRTAVGVREFQLEGERTAVLLDDGELLLSDGVGAPWQTVALGVLDFQLVGERLGVLIQPAQLALSAQAQLVQSSLHLKALSPGAPLTLVMENVVAFQLEGERVAARTQELVHGRIVDTLRVAEDARAPQWTEVWSTAYPPGTGGDMAFALQGDRIGLLEDGTLSLLEGELGGPGVALVVLAHDVVEFQLATGYVAALGVDQVLSVQSATGEPFVDINSGVAEFQLLGDNPDWSSDPLLAYTLLDGSLLTLRSFDQPPASGFPESYVQVTPVFGATASAFQLGHTAPHVYEGVESWVGDRLAVVVQGRLYFQELAPGQPLEDELPTTDLVELTPYPWLATTWVEMNWKVDDPGPKDFVALYYGEPHIVGADQWITGQTMMTTAGSSMQTDLKWRAGYYMAYIHEDADGAYHIVDTAGPTGAGVQALGAFSDQAYPITDWVALGWTMQTIDGISTAGVNDFVALYDHDPMLDPSDADSYLAGQWEWATGASPGTTSTPWAAGYYVGYVQEDHAGNREVILGSPVTAVKDITVGTSLYYGATKNWVQLDWDVTDPGDSDFVALYPYQPDDTTVDGFFPDQFQWASKGPSWASDVPWGKGYWAAYVQVDAHGVRTVKATSEFATDWCSSLPTATASITYHPILFTGWVKLNWTCTQIGPNDFVALYGAPPTQATVGNHYATQWQWAIYGPSWVTDTLWGAGYYVGYVHVDACGNEILIAVGGPS